MTVFIGDVHGKYKPYKRLIAKHLNTVQVGDMGVGFRRTQGPRAGEFQTNPPHYAMLLGNHKFIRGNHDNPKECKRHSQWISDGHIENGVMFVGGAVSTDRAYRVEDHTYWADEELSYKELQLVTDVYLHERPKVMVTHDCPESIAEVMVAISGRAAKLDPAHSSRSRQAFQHMLSAHSPNIWIFGHWHHSFDQKANGTRFVCLAELEAKSIDVGLPNGVSY